MEVGTGCRTFRRIAGSLAGPAVRGRRLQGAKVSGSLEDVESGSDGPGDHPKLPNPSTYSLGLKRPTEETSGMPALGYSSGIHGQYRGSSCLSIDNAHSQDHFDVPIREVFSQFIP